MQDESEGNVVDHRVGELSLNLVDRVRKRCLAAGPLHAVDNLAENSPHLPRTMLGECGQHLQKVPGATHHGRAISDRIQEGTLTRQLNPPPAKLECQAS